MKNPEQAQRRAARRAMAKWCRQGRRAWSMGGRLNRAADPAHHSAWVDIRPFALRLFREVY
jgi:hypothetical protein